MGTYSSYAIVWDADTFEKVLTYRENVGHIWGVDFSPDSTQLMIGSGNLTLMVWDLAARKRVLKFNQEYLMAAKYPPQGDRIATATFRFVQVWVGSNVDKPSPG